MFLESYFVNLDFEVWFFNVALFFVFPSFRIWIVIDDDVIARD